MAFLDELNTICQKEIVPGVVDNVFKNDPLLAYLRQKAPKTFTGGSGIQENFRYGVLPSAAYTPGETFTTQTRQIATGATFQPKYYYVDITVLKENLEVIMKGPNAVFDHLDMLMQTAADTMSAKLSIALYNDGGTSRPKELNGLAEIINDASTASWTGSTYSTYGTLTRTSVGGNKLVSAPQNLSGAEITYSVLEEQYAKATFGPYHPTVGVTSAHGYALIKEVFQPFTRITEKDLNIGFTGVKLNDAVIMVSQYCPSANDGVNDTELGNYLSSYGETLFLLNPEFFNFWMTDAPEYAFGFSGFKGARDDSYLSGQYSFVGNVTCIGPRYQRQIYNFA